MHIVIYSIPLWVPRSTYNKADNLLDWITTQVQMHRHDQTLSSFDLFAWPHLNFRVPPVFDQTILLKTWNVYILKLQIINLSGLLKIRLWRKLVLNSYCYPSKIPLIFTAIYVETWKALCRGPIKNTETRRGPSLPTGPHNWSVSWRFQVTLAFNMCWKASKMSIWPFFGQGTKSKSPACREHH